MKLKVVAGLLLLALVVTGCGGSEKETTFGPTSPPPTQFPAPTLRSTPLTANATPIDLLPTAPALGNPDRPVLILFALPGDDVDSDDLEEIGSDLERAFRNIAVEVQFVTDAQALTALCSGMPAAAWVNAFTYIAARQTCEAEPILALQRGRDLAVGRTAEIVARSEFSDVSDLAGGVFCRIDGQDFTSWVFPSLILANNGINPQTGLAGVNEQYPDQEYSEQIAMVRAIYEGTCDAAAVPAGELEDILEELAIVLSTEDRDDPVSSSELAREIKVLAPAAQDVSDLSGEQGHVIPFEVLALAPGNALPDPIRSQIAEALTEFFTDPDEGEARLETLFHTENLPDASGAVEVSAAEYQAFRSLLENARWDMTFAE